MSSPRLSFGPYEFSPESGDLWKHGYRVKLQPKPQQVLAALLEANGDTVSREELHSRLWPDETFVDFDHGLNIAVKKLRDALGDSASEPRYIETIFGQGYRFHATVEPRTPAELPAANLQTVMPISTVATKTVAQPAQARLEPQRRLLLSGIAASLALAAILGVGAWWRSHSAHAQAKMLYTRADAMMRQGGDSSAEAAEQLLRQAIQRDPKFAPGYNLLAWVLQDERRGKAEYMPLADRAVRLVGNRDDRDAKFIRASHDFFSGEREKAIGEFKALAEIYPDDYWSAENVWNMLTEAGEDSAADDWATHAAELRANDIALQYRAWIANDADPVVAGRFRDRLLQLRRERKLLPPHSIRLDWYEAVTAKADEGDIGQAVQEAKRLAPQIARETPSDEFHMEPLYFFTAVGQLKAAEQLFPTSYWWPELLMAYARGDKAALARCAAGASRDDIPFWHIAAVLLARSGYAELSRQKTDHVSAAWRAHAGLPDARPDVTPTLQYLYASITLGEGHVREAVPLLTQSVQNFSASRKFLLFYAAEDLARALDETGRTEEAIRVLEPLEKDHRFNFETSLTPGTDRLLLAHLYRKAGRVEDAKRVEAELLALWKYADPDFRPLIELKSEAGIQ